MKKFGRRLPGAFFDLRIVVAICGILLSVAAHELFHIVIHWGEIDSIHIFPDKQAIVEILLTPSTHYNLAVEEGIAYGITMITLLLTAMLIGDIHDAKNLDSAHSIIINKHLRHIYTAEEKRLASEHLARILGIESAT